MPARLIDGSAIARIIRDEVAGCVTELVAEGLRPGLAVILVGDDPASAVYVRSKGRACHEAGMYSRTIRMPAESSEEAVLAHVDALNADHAIHGILVQMPLPPQIDSGTVMGRILPEKDVDGFHPVNVGKMLIGDGDGFIPATPSGVMELLRRSGVDPVGRECVIVGRSNIVGKPMAALLIQNHRGANATVTVCHSRTANLAAHTRRADVLIAAAGQPRMITAAMVKPGAVVIDVGINRIADPSTKSGTRLVGDVDFAGVREIASLLTPVPGGVGPMTIAMLLVNTLRAAKRASGREAA
ncbi:MAG: bifunctional methylenetetrahydrofolate dehydrogenase/methenyltetrahydrofolate cyclohydrolase FolD [Gemmatimonadota bacterium]|nr:bifunctional methylenetetrahydrofolate dehydrogenase/methenyltetrahydrofolate cyclohydrolase FolD [Gemmatimonadota bacterium]